MKEKKTTLMMQVHDSILEMIINAGPESDHLLLTEGALVEKFGFSKAPVREALLRLCSEEVLTSIPRCGYVVVRIGEKGGYDNLVVRDVLETSSLERYFDAYVPEKLESIKKMLDDARKNMSGMTNVWNIWQSNVDFHCALMQITDNEAICKHLKQCIEVERRFYAQNQWKVNQVFKTSFYPEVHEAIYNAICEHDKEKSIRLLHMDIMGDPSKNNYQ